MATPRPLTEPPFRVLDGLDDERVILWLEAHSHLDLERFVELAAPMRDGIVAT